MNESSESVTERINAVLKIAHSDRVCPKRKAKDMSRKNPVIEDNLDDSDMDQDYKGPRDEASSSDDSGPDSPDNNNNDMGLQSRTLALNYHVYPFLQMEQGM